MAPGVQLLSSMLVLTLPRLSSSCQARDTPLFLSPYLDSNQVDKARSLCKVDRGCVEDFVPDSFNGFLTVDKELGNHLFFWFFPSTENVNAPLLLWLNGGPTVPSMLGLFYENGPMELVPKEGRPADDCEETRQEAARGYRKRKYSWAGPFSMLYVDNPVGTGFSFSDSGDRGQRITREGYTKDLTAFMKEFLRLFPEYKTREIYFGGQSYAGKYITSLAYEIHTLIQAGQVDFNLTGIYLGAPWYDPETQSEARNDYFFNMGVISEQTRLEITSEYERFYESANVENLTYLDLEKFDVEQISKVDIDWRYDNFVTGDWAPYEALGLFLSNSTLRRAAHVGNTTFRETNDPLFDRLYKDRMLVSLKSEMATLQNFYKVLIYNGDYDAAVPLPSLEASLLSSPWHFQAEYNSSARSIWRRGQWVIGYYSLTDKFCRVVIHGSGHQVPHDRPEIAFNMMKQFIAHGCVRDYNQTIAEDEPSKCTLSGTIAIFCDRTFAFWELLASFLFIFLVTFDW